MTFCLNTTVVNPENQNYIKSAIILLHGYGGNGKDISALSLSWKRHLKNTIFLCPDGHEVCPINPSGFQWFDLSSDNQEYIFRQSLKAEKKINQFIDEVKLEYNLDDTDICLSGFSQGCMMSISVGLTRNKKLNSIIGFSGKIINHENLSSRIKSKINTLLIHGDSDAVVSSSNLLDAKDFFIRNKINIETKMIRNCDHHISVEASSYALNFIKKNLNIK